MKVTDISLDDSTMGLLRALVGKEFDCYKCDPFEFSPCVYGMVGIFVDGKCFKITSFLETVQRFASIDDVARLRISSASEDDIVSLADDCPELVMTPVHSKIARISVVNDIQKITNNSETMTFKSTSGIIFNLADGRSISFEIGTWFSEMITIKKGYNLMDEFTPESEFEDEWKGTGYVPEMTREIEQIE